MKRRPAVFLDRDGVLNEDKGYVFRPSDLRLLAGVPEALIELKRRGYHLIVITNQSGVARGMFSLADVDTFHQAMQDELRHHGIAIDRFYLCPHLADAPLESYRVNCACRKPGIKLIQDAVADFDIDLTSSFLIGDKPTDIACAIQAGIPGIQVVGDTDYVKSPLALAYASSLLEALKFLPS